VRGNQARVKNADLRHSSFTVVMQKRKKRKFASPVLNVLRYAYTGASSSKQKFSLKIYARDVGYKLMQATPRQKLAIPLFH
jgi:hypothetical protein